jgi:GTP-binding protein LepA
LLVDATQGVQAQTLTTLGMAQEAGLVIVPVISKIDSPLARISETKAEIVKLIGCAESDILLVSGKTGEGVESLLQHIIQRIPPPKTTHAGNGFRGLVFDFHYSNHTGVIVYLRVFDGSVTAREALQFCAAKSKCTPIEVGIFVPNETKTETQLFPRSTHSLRSQATSSRAQ